MRSKYTENSGTATDTDEFLFAIASSLGLEKKLLNKKAVVFINGTTTLKKNEIKEKLAAVGVQYATKYSKKVTHVLIGKNPTVLIFNALMLSCLSKIICKNTYRKLPLIS